VSTLETGELRSKLPELLDSSGHGEFQLSVAPTTVHPLLAALRDEHHFDHLPFLTALDRPEQGRIELVYRLFSYRRRSAVTVRALLPRDAPRVQSVSDLFSTADWHERETAELFGITFEGHPDPRRLLTPDGLEGYPLRKDFTHPNLRPLPEVRL
jgi:NADH-quinone oxidoreductase subunit C